MPPDTRFEGKVAIVTGAASGIGRALSSALVARGASVVLADIDGEAAQKIAYELAAGPPGRASGAELDVRDADAVEEIVERTVTDHGHLDLMFNNAGIGIGGEVANMTPRSFRPDHRREPSRRGERRSRRLPRHDRSTSRAHREHCVFGRARPLSWISGVLHDQARGGRAEHQPAGGGRPARSQSERRMSRG